MKKTDAIKAVTFDVGGTLVTPWPSVGHVYSEVARKHGIRVPPGVLNKRFGTAWKQRLEFNHTRKEWAAIVNDTFAGLSDVPEGGITFFGELYDRFSKPEVWKVFDDTVPILEALTAKGIKLGIISNWDERLRPLLKHLKLDGYFDAVVISCEMGFTKPSPVLFEEASKKLGTDAGQILHVGDSHKHDAGGAMAAGFQWRLIDRDAKEPKSPVINSLDELEFLF